MTKSQKNKLIKQIGRLCEKQYRKGFQQGYYARMDNRLTPKRVDYFRLKGAEQDYKKVVSPFTGQKWTSIDRLNMEMYMKGMDELIRFMKY